MSDPVLDACGCCGTGEGADAGVANRPGLPALAYRIGTQPTFLRRMLRRLPSQAVPDVASGVAHPLDALTTRSPSDPAVALLDAWAVVADVLSFYQERIANEGFLRTATERRSVLELARAIGYELNPGVAASTFLAFTVDDSPGGAAEVAVPSGTRVQSVPGPGARPQAFETVEPVVARPAWNAIRAERGRQWRPQVGDTSMYVRGVDTQLQRGDPILIVGHERQEHHGSERWDVRVVQDVTVDVAADRTRLEWAEPLGGRATGPAAVQPEVHALRLRAALFGYNAPDWRALPAETRALYDPAHPDRHEWPNFDIPRHPPVVHLDAAYPKVLPGGWLVLTRPGWTELYRAEKVSVHPRTDYAMSARVTRVRLDTGEHLNFFGLRETAVWAESDQLVPADTPVQDLVTGSRIVLEGLVDGLVEGQAVALTVERPPNRATAPPEGEVAVVRRVTPDASSARTIVDLIDPLGGSYDPATLLVNANVARATHGESVREVLGGGDAATPNQTFVLHRPPLTYVPAPTASGAASTLEVRTDDVIWAEVPSLLGRSPREHVYVVRLADDATPSITFGDGAAGARLPTGAQNVSASYRTGIGPDGEVAAGALTLLLSRPLGVRAVENPVAATGAAAPEVLDDARANAPLTVLTLDRMVSVADYEDFVRSFAGVGKAQASAVWNGASHVVHVTVAGAKGEALVPTSALATNLRAAVDAARDPVRELQLASYRPVPFRARARVLVAPDRVVDDVLARVKQEVGAAFGFARRELGQPVLASEVLALVQGVDGVVACDLDTLHPLDAAGHPVPPLLRAAVGAQRAVLVGGQILAAQLLVLADDGLAVDAMVVR